MSSAPWIYLLAVLLNATNLFFQVFFTILYSDLESDYINPIDLCNKLNKYILPEAAIQGFLTIIFLLNGFWWSFLVTAPVMAFNARKIQLNTHLLDATEIFRTLGKHKKESYIKLGYHLLFFFFFLYCMIVALVRD
ncbi:similar to Saccharomyces cerevisiae YGL054C ERV14 Protein localized to COPII-coated vesicles [Geotrichum candidum]|uniref:Similar to Saccharomyces cerevisiae YGL054C ERV14 Protein localized to COPII-coated vesicles n=1 Tax=Geotrichum candidum TaxID=1173061 RepID=A0A0J9XHW8_GEOCN|nr:similar to Saccharomyces cerevisiae YGL054C ERV14 Protein localized to COPII-coated vesicles [Geotrichum candidum]